MLDAPPSVKNGTASKFAAAEIFDAAEKLAFPVINVETAIETSATPSIRGLAEAEVAESTVIFALSAKE